MRADLNKMYIHKFEIYFASTTMMFERTQNATHQKYTH